MKQGSAEQSTSYSQVFAPVEFDRLLSIFATGVVIFIAGTSFSGWLLGNEELKAVWLNGAETNPNNAVGLALGATSLGLATFFPRARAVPLMLGVVAAVLGSVFLLEYASGSKFGVDNLFVGVGSPNLPGPPSIPTATCLVAIGLALALVNAQRASLNVSRVALAGFATIMGMTGILGHVLLPIDVTLERTLTGFALPTALAYFFLGLGVLAPRRASGRVSETVSVGAPILGLAAMAVLVVMTLSAVSAQDHVREEQDRAKAAGSLLGGLLDLLRDAETSQRGYLLTGDEKYLQPYVTTAPLIASELTRTTALFEHDAEVQDQLSKIRSLAEAKLAELRQTIDLQRAGNTVAAMAIVRTGEGKRLMDELRADVQTMEARWSRGFDELQDSQDRILRRLRTQPWLPYRSSSDWRRFFLSTAGGAFRRWARDTCVWPLRMKISIEASLKRPGNCHRP